MQQELLLQPLQLTVDQLNAEAWKIRVSDSSHALVLSEQAVQLAENINTNTLCDEYLRLKLL